MSKWTHVICRECWVAKHPDQDAHRIQGSPVHACCFCGTATSSGIYVREDPKLVNCGGYALSHQDSD